MFSDFRKGLLVGLMMAGIFLLPACSRADSDYQSGSDYHPSNDWGHFGLGVEVGDPGSWGVSGKFWLDRANAFQPAVKFGNSNAILQLDYLWHNFGLDSKMPIYIGVGGNLLLQSTIVFAGRIPVGISYIFDKRNFPVDIYLQAVPTLWFFSASLTTFNVYGEMGAHIYF